jgi:hypothetical protein
VRKRDIEGREAECMCVRERERKRDRACESERENLICILRYIC